MEGLLRRPKVHRLMGRGRLRVEVFSGNNEGTGLAFGDISFKTLARMERVAFWRRLEFL